MTDRPLINPSITDIVTARVNNWIPKCAVDLRITEKGISYLHPTRGWKDVCWARMGLKKAVAT